MPTTIVNGTNLRFYLGGVAIGEATSCTFELTKAEREILTKDNAGSYTRFAGGQKTATGTAEGLIAYDTANYGVDDLFTAFDNDTELICRFTTGTVGEPYWEASVKLTGLTFAATVNENSTYTATMRGTSAVTQGTES